MVAAPFEYLSVASYDEAVARLVEQGEDAMVLAGGQSLVPMMNLRLVRPSVLVDLNPIGAVPPRAEAGTLRLAALTRHQTLLNDPVVSRCCPLLAEAMRHVGNVRVRARGTIGGSLAHADPTSEIGAAAVVLDAEVDALGRHGARRLQARELFTSYLTTMLAPDEVLTEVRFPTTGPRSGWGFHEMVRRSSDLAIVAVAARIDLKEESDVIALAEVSFAGVGDRVLLADPALLAELSGGALDEVAFASVAQAVADSVHPSDDVHASAAYRRRLVGVLTGRALGDAFRRATRAA